MSIWLFGRRRQGRRWLYSVTVSLFLVIMLIGMAVGCLTQLLIWLRAR